MTDPSNSASLLALPPLSLYVHVPWCVRKCPYCDFNSHEQKGELPEAAYVAALLDDLEQDLGYAQGRSLQSIFIGGGTPSLLSAAAYDKLLAGVEARLPFAPGIEITLEANPGTFEQDKFAAYRRLGINRLSIGIQSFDPGFLQGLGRIHGAEEARRAPEMARAAGFDNVNLDLMFALPGQTLAQALADLESALRLAPTHLSWYQLTLEPNTAFYRRPPVLPGDDAAAAMQEAGVALLAAAGYARYEISAYAQPGRRAAHNLNYWRFGDYLGIGAGAHGKISLPAQGRVLRTRKTRQPSHYLNPEKPYLSATAEIAPREGALEFMMNALRLTEGADAVTFEAHTGLPFSSVAPALRDLRTRGLLEADGERFRPSPRGLQYLNELLLAFME